MRKTIYISILLLSFFSVAQAQKKIIYEDSSLLQKEEPVQPPVEDLEEITTKTIEAPITNDEEDVIDTTLRKNYLVFSYDSVKSWRNTKEYAYTKYLDSLLRDIKKKEVKNEVSSQPPRSGIFTGFFNSGILQAILWAFAIAFVLFILYRLFLADGAFRRKAKQARDEAEVEEEVITNESDFDSLIRQALQIGNYRQAVRYQYLRTLHLLADKNLVQLSPDKTNFQYVSEIANRNHQQPFASLTLNYEYVWYGEFEIDKNIYDKIENSFKGFNQKI